MNKDQKVPEYQQAAKSVMEHAKVNNVSIRNIDILKFRLIPRPRRPQMTRQKHHRKNNLIQVQGKNQQNQRHHLINHPHFRLKAILIMKKHP